MKVRLKASLCKLEIITSKENILQKETICTEGLSFNLLAFLFCRKMNIVDTMFKMLEKYSNDLEETVAVRTMALEDEKKKTENLLSQMLPP